MPGSKEHVALTLRVVRASNVKQAKSDPKGQFKVRAESTTSIASSPTESSPFSYAADGSIGFGFHVSWDMGVLDNTLIDRALNEVLKVDVLELLPKEKLSLIATFSIPLFPIFFRPELDDSGTVTASICKAKSLSVTAKSLFASGKQLVSEDVVLDVEVSISECLLDWAAYEGGRFLQISSTGIHKLSNEILNRLFEDENPSQARRNSLQLKVKFPALDTPLLLQGTISKESVAGSNAQLMTRQGSIETIDEKRVSFSSGHRSYMPEETVKKLIDKKRRHDGLIWCTGTIEGVLNACLIGSVEILPLFSVVDVQMKARVYLQSSSRPDNSIQQTKKSNEQVQNSCFLELELLLDRPLLTKRKLQKMPLESLGFIPPSAEVIRANRESNLKNAELLFEAQLRDTIQRISADIAEKSRSISCLTAQDILESDSVGIRRHELSRSIRNFAKAAKASQSPFYIGETPDSFIHEFRHRLSLKALQEIQRAFGISPVTDSADYEFDCALKIAINCEADHKWQECENAHLKRTALRPEYSSTWWEYGKFLLRRKNYPEAKKCLAKVFGMPELARDCLVAFALLELETGDLEEAFSFIIQAIEANPTDSQLHGVCAIIHEIAEEGKESLIHWASYYDANPENTSLFHLGMRLLDYGGYHCAQMLFSKLVEKEGKNLLADLGIIQMTLQLEELDNAHRYLEASKSKYATDTRLMNLSGDYWFLRKEYRNAYEAYLKALDSPEDASPRTYHRIGLSLSICGTDSELMLARDYIAQSLKLQSDFSTFVDLGKIAIRLNLLAEAERAFTEANLMNPTDGTVWLLLARACVLSEKPMEANLCVKKAMAYSITDRDVIEQLANDFFEKNHERAADSLRAWAKE
eukprot:Partr_v1_DN28008_c0_g1_i6_m57017 putative Tetratricopeptide repeat domain 18